MAALTFTPTDIKIMTREYLSGTTSTELGRRMGCDSSTIIYQLRKAGVPIRRQGGVMREGPISESAARKRCQAGHSLDGVVVVKRKCRAAFGEGYGV